MHDHRKTIWGARVDTRAVSRPVTVPQPMGHTAYNHLGSLGDPSYQPSPSSPYYLFGAQRRYPFAWSGGAGGVPWSRVAAESRQLGIFDLVESGLDFDPKQFIPSPALSRTILHDPAYEPTGDWPLVRPQGYEPDDPRGDGLGLSDNEKKLGLVLVAAGLGFLLWKRMGRAGPRGSRRLARATRGYMRSNPARKRFEVHATASRRARRREYAGSFTRLSEARDYAESLRKGGHKAVVKKR